METPLNGKANLDRPISKHRSNSPIRVKGRPLQVLVSKESNELAPNLALLQLLFFHPRISDSKIVIVSIAGSCRQGKSFLLNFLLKFLESEYSLEWMKNEESAIENWFPWSLGVEPQTSGIVIWSEPFMTYDAQGNKVALLLMDTQGAFNCESSLKQCIQILCLSVMISSIQIYNVMSNITETDLQTLQYFIGYSKLVMEHNNQTPFQRLVFLVRDWAYPYQFRYGAEGGLALIHKRLQTSDSRSREHRELREDLQKCFRDIRCFLLPHPGLKATTDLTFSGQMKDLSEDYLKHVSELIPFLIGRENLVAKQMNGSPVTGKEMYEYFLAYSKVFQTDDLPNPKSVFQATAEANSLAAAAVAYDHYVKSMGKTFGTGKPHTEYRIVLELHKTVKRTSLRMFDSSPKMGDKSLVWMYQKRLEQQIDECFVEFVKQNDLNSDMPMTQTPGVLFVTIVLLYFISGLLNLVRLDFLAVVPDVLCYGVMILLGTWIVVRYSGEHREVSNAIDDVTSALWDRVYLPVWVRVMHEDTSGQIHQISSISSLPLVPRTGSKSSIRRITVDSQQFSGPSVPRISSESSLPTTSLHSTAPGVSS